MPRRRDAARCKRHEIPCRMAPLWLLWGEVPPNGARLTEEVAIICITAIISSAARRLMNIRALTARRDAPDAARQDLFAHIIFVVQRRRRAERRAICRGGCNSLYLCKHIFSGAAIDEYSCSDGETQCAGCGSKRSFRPYNFPCAATTLCRTASGLPRGLQFVVCLQTHFQRLGDR